MKFILYPMEGKTSSNLVCEKIDNEGKISFINDNKMFHYIITSFIQDDYGVVIKGTNLYLFGNGVTLILRKFPMIINNKLLGNLKKSIITKIPEDKLVPEERNATKKKKRDNIFKKNSSLALMLSGAIVLGSVSLACLLTDSNSLKDTRATITKTASKPITLAEHTCIFESLLSEEEFSSLYQNLVDDNIIKNIPVSSESFKNFLAFYPTMLVKTEPNITYEEKCLTVRQRDYLTKDMLDKLLVSMCEGIVPEVKFSSSDEALDYLYENEDRTYYEKMLIIMVRDNLTYDQLDDICAGIVAEGGDYYDEGYRVASVGYNRYHSVAFVNSFGEGLYTQFLAPSQFSVFSGSKPYLKNKGRIDSPGYQGAIDMFYSRQTSIDCLSFRGLGTSVPASWESFMDNGNRFGCHQEESDKYKLEYECLFEEEMIQDTAKKIVDNISDVIKL